MSDVSKEELLKTLQDTITKGLESGVSKKSFDEIIDEARAKIKAKPTKK